MLQYTLLKGPMMTYRNRTKRKYLSERQRFPVSAYIGVVGVCA